MTYFVKKTGSHSHGWFIDANSGDKVCKCGVIKGNNEKRKYHNHTQVHNGIQYHSKLEANYAAQLDYRIQAKDIKGYERQVKIPLKINDILIANYYIDFIVEENDGHFVWTEIKGMELPVWQMKWRILEATFKDHRRTPDDELLVVKEVSTRFR